MVKKRSTEVPVEKKAATPEAAPAESTPASMLADLRNEIDHAFERYFPGFPGLPHPFSAWDSFKGFEMPNLALPKWGMAPNVDVSETDKTYEINAELPGLDEKDIAVTVSDTMITVKGEKRDEREEKKKHYHMQERHFGSFQRSFRLPEDVDAGKIGADFSKGVLKLTLPKTAKAKPKSRRVDVKSD